MIAITLSCSSKVSAQSEFQAWLQSVEPTIVCESNSSATLHFQITGAEPPFFVEYTDGEQLFSFTAEATEASVSVAPGVTTTYTLVSVSSGSESFAEVFGSVTLELSTSPEFIEDLDSSPMEICFGQAAILSVAARGVDLQYQWYKDGQQLQVDGAQTSTFVISSFDSDDYGSYYCTVSSSCSEASISSQSRTLMLAANLELISDLDAGQVDICAGNELQLSVVAAGGKLSYQWRRNGEAILGNESAKSATLYIPATDYTDAGLYDCRIHSECDNSTLLSHSLIVQLVNPVTILNQPLSQSACPSAEVRFSVEVGGSAPVYRWRKNGINIENNPTAFSPTLVLSNVTSADAASYDVQIANNCMEFPVYSDKVQLRVYRSVSVDVSERTVGVCRHGDLSLHANVVGEYPVFQWRMNGKDILDNPSATTATLHLSDLLDDMSADYDVIVQDLCDVVQSASVQVRVYAPIAIERQSTSMSICAGANAHAEVSVSGSAGRYQWYRDGVLLTSQTRPILDIYAIDINESGRYYCRVDAAYECEPASLQSEAIQINVIPPTKVIKEPDNAITALGSTAIFFVQSSGTGNIIDLIETYQWYKDGAILTDDDRVKGSSSAQLEISDIRSSDSASRFVCRVHGACGSATSSVARIIIPPLTISRQPQHVHACVGSTATLNVEARSTQDISLSYQWFKNGFAIAGATRPSLDFVSLSLDDNGIYKLGIILGYKVVVFSNSVSVEALQAPVLDMATPVEYRRSCAGGYLELNAPVLSGTNLKYQWFLDKVAIDGAEQAQYVDYSISSTRNGSYSVTVYNGCASASRVVANVQAAEKPTILRQPEPSILVNAGEMIYLSIEARGEAIQYRWSLNGVEIPGAITNEYSTVATPEKGGYYSVRVFGICGIVYSDNARVNVSVSTDVTTSSTTEGWSMSACRPNPVHDEASILLTAPERSNIDLEFYTAEGQKVLTQHYGYVPAGQTVLRLGNELASLSSGRYMLRIRTESGVVLDTSVLVVH